MRRRIRILNTVLECLVYAVQRVQYPVRSRPSSTHTRVLHAAHVCARNRTRTRATRSGTRHTTRDAILNAILLSLGLALWRLGPAFSRLCLWSPGINVTPGENKGGQKGLVSRQRSDRSDRRCVSLAVSRGPGCDARPSGGRVRSERIDAGGDDKKAARAREAVRAMFPLSAGGAQGAAVTAE